MKHHKNSHKHVESHINTASNQDFHTHHKKHEKGSNKFVSTIFLVIFLLITLLNFIFFPILISLSVFLIFLFPTLIYLILGKITRRWVLSFLLTVVIQLTVLVFLSLWIYKDTNSMINNIQMQPRYIILEENNKPLLAYEINSLDLNANLLASKGQDLPFKAISNAKFNEIKNALGKKDKFVFIIKKEFYNPLPKNLSIDVGYTTINPTKEEIFKLLQSDNPEQLLAKYLADAHISGLDVPPELLAIINSNETSNQISEELNLPKDSVKIAALGLITSQTIQDAGIEYIFESLNNNNLQVKPDYIAVWIIKNLPIKEIKPFLPSDMQGLKLN